jgi:small subunit ribosomal protein S9
MKRILQQRALYASRLRLGNNQPNTQSNNDFYANFNAVTLKPTNATNKHARAQILQRRDTPSAKLSPSYFTGRPLLYDTLNELDALLKTHMTTVLEAEKTHGESVGPGVTRQWIQRDILQEVWNLRLKREEYADMVEKLNRLSLASTRVNDPLLANLLHRFQHPDTHADGAMKMSVVDVWGRAYAVGYRRRLKAHVWVSEASEEGEGRVKIDGREFGEVLTRVSDRARVSVPYEVTDSMGKYNTWVRLESDLVKNNSDEADFGPSSAFAF